MREIVIVIVALFFAGMIALAAFLAPEPRSTYQRAYDAGYEAGQVDAAKGIQHFAATQRTEWVRTEGRR